MGKYVYLSDEILSAIDDALRVAGVKYHGGKQFDKATYIRAVRRGIKEQAQWSPRNGDSVIDLSELSNFAVVKKLYTPDHTGRFAQADLYYPEMDVEVEDVKTTSLLDARDISTRSNE